MVRDPTVIELIDAVVDWLPNATGDGFGWRLARSALGIARRELAFEEEGRARAAGRIAALLGRNGDLDSLEAALSYAIRHGAISPDDPAVLDHLEASARDRLIVDQPNYPHMLDELA